MISAMHQATKSSCLTLSTLVFTILYAFAANAGTPLWTFAPTTATTIELTSTEKSVIEYRITNQSRKRQLLKLSPLPGITQLVGHNGECSSPFTLSYKQSCQLTLEVDGRKIEPTLTGGPVVCADGNVNQCYQPSQANSLNIKVVKY